MEKEEEGDTSGIALMKIRQQTTTTARRRSPPNNFELNFKINGAQNY